MARIKVAPTLGAATYHCISRIVHGQRLLGSAEKKILRNQMWQIAEFCGVQILTYAILSNHFHILLFIPQFHPLDDAELRRRLAILYPGKTRYETSRLATLCQQLADGGPEAEACRQRLLALMGDVSQFMKMLKQRFTRWFNQYHGHFGTLWAERFKSVLVEAKGHATRSSAGYIDLNPVRAGLAIDPADYQFCGYSEAVGGYPSAQRGIALVTGMPNWPDAQKSYRQMLFSVGSRPNESGTFLSVEQLQQVIKEGGQLPLSSLLRCRAHYFTGGEVLGSFDFIQSHVHRRGVPRMKSGGPRLLPPIEEGIQLATLTRLRGQILTRPTSELSV